MAQLFKGYERRLLRHLIKKEIKLVNYYYDVTMKLTGYARCPTTIGLYYRRDALEKLLDKLS